MDIVSTATEAVVLGAIGALLYFQTRGLRHEMDRRFDQVDRRFEHVDHRFEQVDRRFERLEAAFGEVRSDLLNLAISRRSEPPAEAGP